MYFSIGVLFASVVTLATAQGIPDPNLIGTWSSKSNKTLTGSVGRRYLDQILQQLTFVFQGFYNPINETLIEPSHPGISYSFSDNGHYEVAYYRAIANRESSHDV